MTHPFSYVVVLPKKNESHLWNMNDWCRKQFGVRWQAISRNDAERNGVWTVFWCGRENPTAYRWLFKNEYDAVLFTLKWA